MAGPLSAFARALAVMLLATGPALARPHGSPDLTPTVFLPRHPDFELLSLVGCLSGPCADPTVVAQVEEAEPTAPAPAASAAGGPGSTAPAVVRGGSPQRPAAVAAPGAAVPVLDAAALGAAGVLRSNAAHVETELRPAGTGRDHLAVGGEIGATGEVDKNAALAPDFTAGNMTEKLAAGADRRAAGDLLVASLPDAIELRPAGEIEDNIVDEADLRPAGEVAAPASSLLSLRGRQAALDEAFGVGGLASGQMLGLRRLSLTSPNTTRNDADGTPQAPVRTALRDLGQGPAEIVTASHSPMDSDERKAIRRPSVDRRTEPKAPVEESRAPGAPTERVVAPAEPAVPLEPRAPGRAAPPGAGGSAEPTSPQLSNS